MGLVARMFGRAAAKADNAARPSRPSGLGVTATRGQLVRMAHRDTMRRHGIPEQWLGIEAMTAKDSRGSLGVHARLVVRNAESGLVAHLPHLIDLIRARLAKLDQSSAQWLCGTSVRFDLPSGYAHQPMPPAGFWKEATRGDAEPEREVARQESARDWLDRMFASSPASREPLNDFRPTQPMFGHHDA